MKTNVFLALAFFAMLSVAVVRAGQPATTTGSGCQGPVTSTVPGCHGPVTQVPMQTMQVPMQTIQVPQYITTQVPLPIPDERPRCILGECLRRIRERCQARRDNGGGPTIPVTYQAVPMQTVPIQQVPVQGCYGAGL